MRWYIDPLPKEIMAPDFIAILARMARMTFGNTNMPKFCIQCLVRIVATADSTHAKAILNQLLENNIVDLLAISLRSGKQ